MRVLITAPLRQEPKIFREYQDSLDRLIVPEGVTVDRFFVVNDCPEVIPYIRDAYWIEDNANQVEAFVKTNNNHLWTQNLLDRMSILRNRTIDYALENMYDYWLSADTDLVLDQRTLITLLEADKDIVSELWWTEGKHGWWCNAWLYDQCGGFDEAWKRPGLYQVGMTCGLVLAKRKVLEAGVNYSRIPNIRDILRGEDRFFCVRAVCHGFEIWTDTHAEPVHLYTEKVYQDYKAGRVRTCSQK